MARLFAKVSEEEIEEAFFYPSDLVNTKTTIPLRVGEERGGYIPRRFASRYIYDVPQDFGPVVAFGTKVEIPVARQ